MDVEIAVLLQLLVLFDERLETTGRRGMRLRSGRREGEKQ
jgi:hypothetical protein